MIARTTTLIILSTTLAGCTSMPTTELPTIAVGSQQYSVEIARSAQDQQQGLSDRKSLSEDTGMLFVYSPRSTPIFWMKDMRFSIDILWIANDTVIGIEHNVVADDGIALYPAPQPVDAVLELNAGTATRDNLNVGDSIQYPVGTWK